MEFEVVKNGPTVPTGVNQKSFNSVKIGAGETKVFKAGDVIKITGGKIRLRNDAEKSFNDGNSAYAEKGDIVTIQGAVFAANEDKNDHASMRVKYHYFINVGLKFSKSKTSGFSTDLTAFHYKNWVIPQT